MDLIAVVTEFVHQSLGNIFNDRKATGHITIKGAVAYGHLTLVARGEHQSSGLVGERHQEGASYPRLDILFRSIGFEIGKLITQNIFDCINGLTNWDLVVLHPQVFSELARIDP